MPFQFNPFTKKLDLVDQLDVPPGTVATLTGDTGGAVGPDGSGNINVVGGSGSGVQVTGDPMDNTLSITTPGGGFTWSVQSDDFQAVKGNGYYINSVDQIQVTMPDPLDDLIGDTFIISDVGGGTFKIIENSGDIIQLGDSITTITTGSITSQKIGDTLMFSLWAVSPGQSWVALQPVGNFTVA